MTVPIHQVPQFVRIAYRARLAVLLRGKHGIGKSEVLKQTANALAIALIVLDLSLLEAVDLLGIPRIEKDGRTHYAPPARLPQSGQGILLLEELNRASRQTRAPALELLTSRRLHDYELPEGWVPCAAVNPTEGDYQVDVLDPALTSRFLVLDVEPDQAAWIDWATSNGVHPDVIDFVEQTPAIFTDSGVNPRSLEYASNFIKAMEADGENVADRRIQLAAIEGLLGTSIATAFVRFRRDTLRAPKADKVLTSYNSARPVIQNAVRKGRLDVITSTIDLLERRLKTSSNWNDAVGDPATAENLKQFLSDIPPDLRDGFLNWARALNRPVDQVKPCPKMW